MKLKLGIFSIIIILTLSVLPFEIVTSGDYMQGPSMNHWLGTDSLGRDLLLRVLQGSRVSISIGIMTSFGSLLIGAGFALYSMKFAGKIDAALTRLLEILMALPNIVILSVVVLAFKNIFISNTIGTQILILSLGLILTSWMGMARQIRTLLGAQYDLPYVESARAVGCSKIRILIFHILPNIKIPILVLIGIQIPSHLLFESYLSFIGLGIQPPVASWGVLIQEGWKTLSQYPHLILAPSLFLFITVFSFNLIFDEFHSYRLVQRKSK